MRLTLLCGQATWGSAVLQLLLPRRGPSRGLEGRCPWQQGAMQQWRQQSPRMTHLQTCWASLVCYYSLHCMAFCVRECRCIYLMGSNLAAFIWLIGIRQVTMMWPSESLGIAYHVRLIPFHMLRPAAKCPAALLLSLWTSGPWQPQPAGPAYTRASLLCPRHQSS